GPALRDEQVLAKRVQGAVMLELRAAIVGFGAGGEHLDQHRRVGQDVAVAVGQRRLAADHDDVRIGIEAPGGDQDSQVVDMDLAGTTPELPVELRAYIDGYQAVPPRGSRHADD